MKSNDILLLTALFTVMLLAGCSASSSSFASAGPARETAAQTGSYETASAAAELACPEYQTPLLQTAPASAPDLTLKNYFPDRTDSLVTDSLCLSSGNYSWSCTVGDETTSQIACGAHPLDEAMLHPSRLILSKDDFPQPAYSFSFTGGLYPDSLTIRKWSRDDIGNPQASPLSVTAYVSPLPLLELRDGYVYEITAEWKEENAAENGCYGIASYVVVTENELFDPVTLESCSGVPPAK